MAILYDEKSGAHIIKRGGVVIDTLAAARFESALADRALEADIKADLEGKASLSNRACVVLLHIFERSPLRYFIRVAPPGYTPPKADWWEGDDPGSELGSLT
jgi:hypothetical protein